MSQWLGPNKVGRILLFPNFPVVILSAAKDLLSAGCPTFRVFRNSLP